jgi:hypothetical protein
VALAAAAGEVAVVVVVSLANQGHGKGCLLAFGSAGSPGTSSCFDTQAGSAGATAASYGAPTPSRRSARSATMTSCGSNWPRSGRCRASGRPSTLSTCSPSTGTRRRWRGSSPIRREYAVLSGFLLTTKTVLCHVLINRIRCTTPTRSNGADRLRDLLGPHAPITTENYAAAPSSSTFSFQREVVPLLRVLTAPQIRKAVVSQWANRLYATLHGMEGLELRLARLVHECCVEEKIAAAWQGGHGPKALAELWPDDWNDVLLPTAYLMREVVNRVGDAAAEEDFREALAVLRASLDACMGREGGRWRGLGRVVADVLKGVQIRVEAVESRLRLGDERTRAAEAERLRRAAYSRARGAFV